MTRSIFYSWQSDTPSKCNKAFIRDSLDRAIKTLAQATDLDSAVREELELDQDTKGVAGSPELVNTILEKIDNCSVFVPDLTCVGAADDGSRTPNPNVLIELGYAAKSVGFECFVMVMNEYYGSPDEHMPFDLKHRRFPIRYNLSPDASKAERRKLKAKLTKDLEFAIRAVLKEKIEIEEDTFQPIEPVFKSSSYLKDGELLAELSELDYEGTHAYWLNGPQLFVRLLPTHTTEPKDPHELNSLIGRQPNVSTLGRIGGGYFEPNKYGAVIFGMSNEGKVRTLTQLHVNGEIWGLASLGADVTDRRALPIPYIYERTLAALDNYVKVSESHLGNNPPFRAIVGVSDIEGFGVIGQTNTAVGKCFKDEIILERDLSSSEGVLQLAGDFVGEIQKLCGIK